MSLLSGLGKAFGINSKSLGTIRDIGVGLLTGGPAGALAAGAANLAGNLKPAINVATAGGAPTSNTVNAIRQLTSGANPVSRLAADPRQQQIGLINIGSPPPLPQGPGFNPGNQTQSGWPGVQSGSSSTAPSPGCQKGYHLNKAGYYSRKRGGWVPAGTVCVKNRRRNPLNPRALSRSISRISSAKNAARFLSRVTVREGGCGCK